MKSWLRALGLSIILATISLSSVNAWPPEYGNCYITCGETQYPYQSTYQDCCSGPHYCPDGSFATSAYWAPYEGWPKDCPPYYLL